MGSVLPLHSPWRVAEEIGILDHLSGGRLEIGYSSGTGPLEPERFRLREANARLAKLLEYRRFL